MSLSSPLKGPDPTNRRSRLDSFIVLLAFEGVEGVGLEGGERFHPTLLDSAGFAPHRAGTQAQVCTCVLWAVCYCAAETNGCEL